MAATVTATTQIEVDVNEHSWRFNENDAWSIYIALKEHYEQEAVNDGD